MTAVPLVSVVMPVYNGEKYLHEAIESILTQTFRDFEFIVIDDGSTDGTSAILAQYQKMDRRIRVACNPENQGQPASLNKGCHLAKGKYIARMDADDVSLAERLERQVEYIEAHPEIGVLGTWIERIDEKGTRRERLRMPTRPALIGWSLVFGNCIAAPSVMIRRDLVERLGFFRSEARDAEDYDLWARAISVTRIVNLPQILVQYRSHEESVSSRHSESQEQTALRIMRSMITRLLGSEVSDEVTASLQQMAKGSSLDRLQQIEPVARLIQQLYRAYMESNCLTRTEAKEVALDARGKLLILAVSASKFSLWKGVLILIQALRLCPQPLSTRTIARGLRMFVGSAWMERSRHQSSARMAERVA
jgi:GT2 family glycosyltransferase